MLVRKFWVVFLVLMTNAAFLFAQPGEPCGGTDPDATCPLDGWVWFLAAAAVIFAAVQLRRKQRSLLNNSEGTR
jgi:hypothetical protein